MTLISPTLTDRQRELAASAVLYLSKRHDAAALIDGFECTHDELTVLSRLIGADLTLSVDQRELASTAVEYLRHSLSDRDLADAYDCTPADLDEIFNLLQL